MKHFTLIRLPYALPSEIEGGRVSSSQDSSKYLSAPFCELCLSHSVVTDWDDLIVDVHKKTTTIEVRILCNPSG
jgi:hypothetical protein